MQQLTFVEAGRLRWTEVKAPKLDSDHAAIVRPIAVATCDLDAEIIAGRSPFQGPFPLGHEGVAEVVDAGDAVSGLAIGDRVSVPFQVSCGVCAPCGEGHTANCASVPRSSTYGFGPQVHELGGFFSDAVRVPFANHMLVPVPDALASAAIASASDNIPDGWRAVGPRLAERPGAEVLVVGGTGAGSIGLYAAGLAVALGAGRVVYVDEDPRRCEVARAMGSETLAGPWPRRLGPFPITVCASSTQEGLDLALRSTAPDGHCTSTGIFLGPQPTMPMLEMYEKVVTFRTGRTHSRPSIPAVLDIALNQNFSPALVTTRTADWTEAIDALLEPGWVKLVFERAPREYRQRQPQ